MVLRRPQKMPLAGALAAAFLALSVTAAQHRFSRDGLESEEEIVATSLLQGALQAGTKSLPAREIAVSPVALDTDKTSTKARGRIRRSNVVFVKLFKVGSTTLQGILQRYADQHGLHSFNGYANFYDGLALQELTMNYSGAFNMWVNHVHFDAKLLDTLVPQSTKIAIFRSPRERVLSSWRYGLSDDRFVGYAMGSLKEMTAGVFPTEMCSLRGMPYSWPAEAQCCGPRAGLAMSAQISLDAFSDLDYALLTESYNQGLLMLRRFMGWELPDVLYLERNVVKSPAGEVALQEFKDIYAEAERIVAGNTSNAVEARYHEDCVLGKEASLYELAKRKFDEQWAAFSAEEREEIEQELPRFESALAVLSSCCESEHALSTDLFCGALNEDRMKYYARHGEELNAMALPYPRDIHDQSEPNAVALAKSSSPSRCEAQALAALHGQPVAAST